MAGSYSHRSSSKARCGRLLAAGSLALGLLFAAPVRAQLPDEPAPAAVASLPAITTLEFDWHDPLRGRAVPVRLYLPSTEPSARVPLVVFSHGIGGSRRGYSYLGNHFAANGIAALHVQHVGSDRALWMGNPFGLVGRLQDAAQEREAVDRALDLRFALDRLLASDAGAIVDRDNLVVAGHSYGANTALLAVGARVERAGRMVDYRDARYRAAILISAPPFYGESDPSRILRHVTVPTLHITATEDVIQIPGYYSGAEDRIAVFEAIGSSSKTLAVFSGGSHSIFTDRPGTGGAQLNPQVKAATRELALAFIRQVFGGTADTLERWSERHRPILARIVTSPGR
jgi:predicted dienelactone hydrolase